MPAGHVSEAGRAPISLGSGEQTPKESPKGLVVRPTVAWSPPLHPTSDLVCFGRCLPESRPKAERFPTVRRRSDELCSGCRCPKWWKQCPGTTPGFHGNRSGSAEDYSSSRSVPGMRPGQQKSTPTEIGSGTRWQQVQVSELFPSRRPAPARTVSSPLGGAGLGRPAEWSGRGPPMGLPSAKLRELAQSTLPSLREVCVGPAGSSKADRAGRGFSARQFAVPRLGCACSCQKRSPARTSRRSRLGQGRGRRARQSAGSAQAAFEPVSTARRVDIPQ